MKSSQNISGGTTKGRFIRQKSKEWKLKTPEEMRLYHTSQPPPPQLKTCHVGKKLHSTEQTAEGTFYLIMLTKENKKATKNPYKATLKWRIKAFQLIEAEHNGALL